MKKLLLTAFLIVGCYSTVNLWKGQDDGGENHNIRSIAEYNDLGYMKKEWKDGWLGL
jgi:hypothetical protein